MPDKPFHILIADDDEEDIELIEEAILSFEPQTRFYKVNDGKAALEYLHNRQDHELPSLIILDFNMPELNGTQVLSHIYHQTRYHAIPRIILSTSDAPLYIYESRSQGATAYFVKPNTRKDMDLLAKKILALCRLD